jgi:peptidoglycan/LPS O-acetylase OafA/YrhL
MAAAPRHPGLDALRAAAAVAVVSIHTTLGPENASFWPALSFRDRFANHFADSLSRFAVAAFVATSFFLLARSLEGRPAPYGEVVRKRARRILPAYLFWSVLYMLVQGLRQGGVRAGFSWMGRWDLWLKALVLGIPPNMYHLWFLPLLLALTLAFPLARALGRGPVAIVAALGLLAAWRVLIAHPPAALVGSRFEDFWWRGAAVVGYAAFATLGWAAHGALRRGVSPGGRAALCAAGLAAIIWSVCVFAGEAARQAGTVAGAPEGPLYFWALYAYPAGLFALFAFGWTRRPPGPRVVRLAERSFGVYLAHPLALMLFDRIERHGVNPGADGFWALKTAVAVAIAWAITAAMVRSPRLARFVR